MVRRLVVVAMSGEENLIGIVWIAMKILMTRMDFKMNDSRELGTLETRIVGIQYYEGEVDKGDKVSFKRDPANTHDKNAIEVHNPGNKMVGHLPGEYVAFLAPLIDEEKITLEGVVGFVEDRWFIPLELSVSVTPKGEDIISPRDTEEEIHKPVLELFDEWPNVSERRQMEIAEECGEFLARNVSPETKLLIYLMGGNETKLDEELEPPVANLPFILNDPKKEVEDFQKRVREADSMVSQMEKMNFINEHGDWNQRMILRATLDGLVEEILNKGV
jgi:hypothetical protein